jgi:uncharacterized membrane protein
MTEYLEYLTGTIIDDIEWGKRTDSYLARCFSFRLEQLKRIKQEIDRYSHLTYSEIEADADIELKTMKQYEEELVPKDIAEEILADAKTQGKQVDNNFIYMYLIKHIVNENGNLLLTTTDIERMKQEIVRYSKATDAEIETDVDNAPTEWEFLLKGMAESILVDSRRQGKQINEITNSFIYRYIRRNIARYVSLLLTAADLERIKQEVANYSNLTDSDIKADVEKFAKQENISTESGKLSAKIIAEAILSYARSQGEQVTNNFIYIYLLASGYTQILHNAIPEKDLTEEFYINVREVSETGDGLCYFQDPYRDIDIYGIC